MATLIRSIRNETNIAIEIKVPGFNPSTPVILNPNVIVDMLVFVSSDELEALQPVLASLVDAGTVSQQATIESADLHPANYSTSTDLSEHTGVTDAHHTKYTNSEALDASVLTGALQSGEAGDIKAPTHSAVSTGLTGKEDTGVASGLISTHNTAEAAHSTEFGAKAAKTVAVVAADAISVANADGTASITEVTADANVQTGAYVQVDVESIRTLTNSLKTNYNDLQTKYDVVKDLANDNKAAVNIIVTLINELKAKVDTMNT